MPSHSMGGFQLSLPNYPEQQWLHKQPFYSDSQLRGLVMQAGHGLAVLHRVRQHQRRSTGRIQLAAGRSLLTSLAPSWEQLEGWAHTGSLPFPCSLVGSFHIISPVGLSDFSYAIPVSQSEPSEKPR